jgi:hypothetical protein
VFTILFFQIYYNYKACRASLCIKKMAATYSTEKAEGLNGHSTASAYDDEKPVKGLNENAETTHMAAERGHVATDKYVSIRS